MTLADAASRLGTSKEALRKRIARGSIQAEKRGGRWYVLIEADNDQDGVPDDIQDASTSQQGVLVAALQARIDSLERQLAVRDDELQRRDEEVRRVHMLLAAALERLAALPATIDVDDVTNVPPDVNPGPLRGDVATERPAPPRPAAAALARVWRRWWRRIRAGS